MNEISVKKILESVLNENKSTEHDLLRSNSKLVLDSAREAHLENPVPDPADVLVLKLMNKMVDREMAIYENVEKTLQRVIDELQSKKQ